MKSKHLIQKIISCILLAAAVFMLFSGWITVTADRDTKRIVKNAIGELDEEIEDGYDDIRDVEETLDDLDINISPRKLLKSLDKACDVIKDLSVSPSEFGTLSSGFSKVYQMVKEIYDNDYFGWYDVDESVVLGCNIITWWLRVSFIFFIIIIAVSVLVLISHILNKKTAGYYLIALYAVLFIVCLVSVFALNYAIEDTFSYYNFDTSLFRITWMPIFAIICSIASSICWSYAQKDYVQSPTIQYGSANIPYSDSNVCKNCGAPLKAEAAFCSNCGAKAEPQQQDTTTVFCPNCGQSIPADTTFCPNCGNKI